MNGAAAGLMMKARGPKHENNNRNFLLLIVAHPFHLLCCNEKMQLDIITCAGYA
jgi:hypothetical protein